VAVSLITDALKAAQAERERSREQAPDPLAERVISRPRKSPAGERRRAESVSGASVKIGGPIGIASALFGVAVLVAVGLVVAAPGGAGEAVPPDRFSAPVRPVARALPPPTATTTAPASETEQEIARPGSTTEPKLIAAEQTVQAPARESVEEEPAASAAAPASLVTVSVPSPPSDRRDADRLFASGVSAQRRGDLQEAAQLYTRALAINPTGAELLNNLGTVYQASGDLPRARDTFRRAVTANPDYAGAWSNLGVVLAALGDQAGAIDALREALRADPTNAGAKVNLAARLEEAGVHGEAQRLLEEALREQPRLAEAHYALGRLLEGQGDFAGAATHYTRFLEVADRRFPALEPLVRQRIDQLRARIQ
jgi:Tfp pilus assembly protein PilF